AGRLAAAAASSPDRRRSSSSSCRTATGRRSASGTSCPTWRRRIRTRTGGITTSSGSPWWPAAATRARTRGSAGRCSRNARRGALRRGRGEARARATRCRARPHLPLGRPQSGDREVLRVRAQGRARGQAGGGSGSRSSSGAARESRSSRAAGGCASGCASVRATTPHAPRTSRRHERSRRVNDSRMDVRPMPGLEHLPWAEVWFREIDEAAFAQASAAARAIGKDGLEVWTTDATPAVVAFLEPRGYDEVRRYVISEFDVEAAPDPDPPVVRLATLAERPDLVPELFAIAAESYGDQPGRP